MCPSTFSSQHLVHSGVERNHGFFRRDPDIAEDMVKIKRRNTWGAGAKECWEASNADGVFLEMWSMLYADDAGIVSQSPGSLGKMISGYGGGVHGVRPDRLGSQVRDNMPSRK